MAKQVRYMAEVVSIGPAKFGEQIKQAKNGLKIGDRFPVKKVDTWAKRMAFSIPKSVNRISRYCLLSKCAHLDGGSWKLIPYEVEEN